MIRHCAFLNLVIKRKIFNIPTKNRLPALHILTFGLSQAVITIHKLRTRNQFHTTVSRVAS